MVLKTYKPTSPGLRQLVIVDRSELYKGAPEKSLTIGLTKTGGRDNFGHVTSRRKGGGHKRKLRIIDFRRNKFDVEATVERIEYDPNRSAFIALICYEDGEKSYILGLDEVGIKGRTFVDVGMLGKRRRQLQDRRIFRQTACFRRLRLQLAVADGQNRH